MKSMRNDRRFCVCLLLTASTVAILAGCTSATTVGTHPGSRSTGTSRGTVSTSTTRSTALATTATTHEPVLNSVSCLSDGYCLSVGSSAPGPGSSSSQSETLIRTASGAQWSAAEQIQPTDLASVSCVVGNVCMAIGGSGTTATFEEWTGQSWVTLPAPPTGPVQGQPSTAPQSLSCASITFCAAVGGYALNAAGGGGETAVVENWNGQAWSTPQTPALLSTHPGNVLLSSVSCVTSSFCMAVGQQQTGAQFLALAVTWDGSHWTSVPPPPQNGSVSLQSVSCASIDYCFAVGVLDPPGNTGQTQIVAEAWNGSSWTTEPAPLPFGHDLSLSLATLTCPAPSQCLVVWSSTATANRGHPTPSNAAFAAVSQFWNGANWSSVPISNPDSSSNEFNVVYSQSCTNTTDCTIVGTKTDGLNQASLIESWDGTKWTSTAAPSPTPVPTSTSVP